MKLEQYLNKQIANCALMYFKLHRFHWFIEGPNFFELHEKFQELYEEQTAFLDEFAERLLAIGGKPASTMKEYLELSSISEDGSETSTKETMNTLIQNYGTFSNELREGIILSEEEGDNVTADMLIKTKESVDKSIWMFKQTAK